MTDEQRLSSRPLGLGPRLLRAGRAEEPSQSSRDRAARVARLAVAGGILDGGAAGGGARGWKASWMGALAIVGVGAFGVLWASWPGSASAPAPAAAVAPPPAPATASTVTPAPWLTVTRPAAVAAPASEGSSPRDVLSLPPVPPAATQPPRRAAIAAPASPARRGESVPGEGEDSFGRELRAIERARLAVAARDGASAIETLDAYARDFPHGQLSQEATLLRLEALLDEGQRAQAEALAQRFLQEHPSSPLAQRVRSLSHITE
jgi:hypothetical protein